MDLLVLFTVFMSLFFVTAFIVVMVKSYRRSVRYAQLRLPDYHSNETLPPYSEPLDGCMYADTCPPPYSPNFTIVSCTSHGSQPQ
jgi:hypothetical protein